VSYDPIWLLGTGRFDELNIWRPAGDEVYCDRYVCYRIFVDELNRHLCSWHDGELRENQLLTQWEHHIHAMGARHLDRVPFAARIEGKDAGEIAERFAKPLVTHKPKNWHEDPKFDKAVGSEDPLPREIHKEARGRTLLQLDWDPTKGYQGQGPRKQQAAQTKVRDKKRGQYAWQHVQSSARVAQQDIDRLLVHSVADSTALQSYLPAVKLFLQEGIKHQWDVRTWWATDRAVCRYLGDLCATDVMGTRFKDRTCSMGFVTSIQRQTTKCPEHGGH